MPIQPGIPLTKSAVLEKVTQEQIFEKYLGLPIEEGVQYCNPLRIDNTPGCKYYYNAIGTLYFHDFGKYHWDCFAVVQFRFNVSFIDSIKIIIRDFNLNGLQPNIIQQQYSGIKVREEIRVSIREWEISDLQYWRKYNIDIDTLKNYRIFACKSIWLNGEYYVCKKNDPCYCYYFGDNLYKLYFPARLEYGRFFQNLVRTDEFLMGMSQLPGRGDKLIITKSYKDAVSISTFQLNAASVFDEYHIITERLFLHLKERFPIIYTLFDNDTAGRQLSIKYQRKFNTIPLLFPKTYAKDFTDCLAKKGVQFMRNLINTYVNGH